MRKANNIKDMQVDFCFKIRAEILNFTPDFDKTSANSALFQGEINKILDILTNINLDLREKINYGF